MTGTTHPQAAAYDTWAEVVVLLDEAANRGYRDSATDPALHSTALAAHALAAAALELLPVEQRARVDQIPLRRLRRRSSLFAPPRPRPGATPSRTCPSGPQRSSSRSAT